MDDCAMAHANPFAQHHAGHDRGCVGDDGVVEMTMSFDGEVEGEPGTVTVMSAEIAEGDDEMQVHVTTEEADEE